jgi:hypothetical protein
MQHKHVMNENITEELSNINYRGIHAGFCKKVHSTCLTSLLCDQ